MCHDNGSGAIGLFSITEPGTYAWQSTATADFKHDDSWMALVGVFANQWNAVGTWGEGWIWFSNDYGGTVLSS